MRGVGLWALGVGLILAGPAQAQEARLAVLADSVFVGERFTLAVTVTRPAGAPALFPEIPPGDAEAGPLLAFGDAEVFAARRLPPRLDGALRVDSLVYEAATFALDAATVGPVAVRVVSGADTTTVRTNTVRLPIRSVLPAPEADLLPPTPPEPFPSPWPAWLALAFLGLGLLALAFWLWRRVRRGAGRSAPRPAPYPEALQRLSALDAARPRTADAVKAHYVELADLLRTYLARTLGVPALELTTRELTEVLRHDARLPEAALSAVRGTLRLADLVKFADLRPDAEAHVAARARAREAIEALEAAVHPPENLKAEDGSQKTEERGTSPEPPVHPLTSDL